ncbi:hypothetical protein EYF80_020143 [Liparis tanakae]|uniref:Uncharacterized protein n=1 Tax=Liparis tanakae TaxID=230148 RepID=A0A4Z2HXG6_9TELE|nr:hypothetical protein EYF80_020143 [Liparis tanakae]
MEALGAQLRVTLVMPTPNVCTLGSAGRRGKAPEGPGPSWRVRAAKLHSMGRSQGLTVTDIAGAFFFSVKKQALAQFCRVQAKWAPLPLPLATLVLESATVSKTVVGGWLNQVVGRSGTSFSGARAECTWAHGEPPNRATAAPRHQARDRRAIAGCCRLLRSLCDFPQSPRRGCLRGSENTRSDDNHSGTTGAATQGTSESFGAPGHGERSRLANRRTATKSHGAVCSLSSQRKSGEGVNDP